MRKARVILKAKPRHSNLGFQSREVASLDSLDFLGDSQSK